jgi:hypothetical protein
MLEKTGEKGLRFGRGSVIMLRLNPDGSGFCYVTKACKIIFKK